MTSFIDVSLILEKQKPQKYLLLQVSYKSLIDPIHRHHVQLRQEEGQGQVGVEGGEGEKEEREEGKKSGSGNVEQVLILTISSKKLDRIINKELSMFY